MSTATDERDRELATMRDIVKPGDTVRTILRHVSRSGMMRHISVVVLDADGPHDRTWSVGKVLDLKLTRDGDNALKVSGCGMDMGFHVVYELSSALYPDGFACIGENCPSNDHSNGDRNHEPHHHKDGGYALLHRWL